MIYRIRNPYVYKEKQTITELDSVTGEVWHCDGKHGRRKSEFPFSHWVRLLAQRGMDLESEHTMLDQLDDYALDMGL